ncbi:MAG: S8 family peptidase [Gammaproteobacteria bacterium]
MNARGFLPALFAAVLLAACADRMSVAMGTQDLGGEVRSPADRRILVTFVDRSMERAPLAHAATRYRPRGAYRSSAWSKRIASKLAEDYQLNQVAEWPVTALGVHCVVYEIAMDQSIEQVVESMSYDKRLDSVQKMHLFRVRSDPYYRFQTGLHSMQIEAAHRWATGRSVTVAIVDTGVDFNHPDLKGQVYETRDFVTDDFSAFVDDSHGTAVAGVIAALADNGEGIVGIAPHSKLIALKACWPEKPNALAAVCDSLTLAKALNRAIGLRPNILNLSLTGPPDPLLKRLLDRAIQRGIIIVTADSENPDPIHSFPASIENVIAVRAALTQEGAGPATDASLIVAPGSEVLTTLPHATYNFISGSSLAAAHVSGVVALLVEMEPDVSAARLKKILHTMGDDAGQASGLRVSGLVNACTAIDKLRGIAICSEPVD